MKKKKFYKIGINYNIIWANVGTEHKFDFWKEAIYKLPLEYPHIFKMINGEFSDYTGTDTHAIISDKLRRIIEKYVLKNSIEWIHVKVENKDGSLHDGYIPRFVPIPNMFDFLHESSILTDRGKIMVPRLSSSKMEGKHFVKLFENYLINYVSEDLKKEMEKENITGIGKFDKVNMYP